MYVARVLHVARQTRQSKQKRNATTLIMLHNLFVINIKLRSKKSHVSQFKLVRCWILEKVNCVVIKFACEACEFGKWMWQWWHSNEQQRQHHDQHQRQAMVIAAQLAKQKNRKAALTLILGQWMRAFKSFTELTKRNGTKRKRNQFSFEHTGQKWNGNRALQFAYLFSWLLIVCLCFFSLSGMCEVRMMFWRKKAWKQKQNKTKTTTKNDDNNADGVSVCLCGSALHNSFGFSNMHLSYMMVALLWMMLSLLRTSAHSLPPYSVHAYFVVKFRIQMEICVWHFFSLISLLRFVSFHFISAWCHCRCFFFLPSFFLSFFLLVVIVGDFLVVFQLSYISHAFHFIICEFSDQLTALTSCTRLMCMHLDMRTPFSDNSYFSLSLSFWLSVWDLPLLTWYNVECVSTLDELFFKALLSGSNHAIYFTQTKLKAKTEMR